MHVQIIQLIEIPLIYIRQWQEHLPGGHWRGGARLRHPQGAVDDVEKWRGKPGKHEENTGRMEELGTCSKQLEKNEEHPEHELWNTSENGRNWKKLENWGNSRKRTWGILMV